MKITLQFPFGNGAHHSNRSYYHAYQQVRLSAGRLEMSLAEQALCFLAGANSIFSGEKLLTVENPTFEDDNAMFQLFGLKKRASFTRKKILCLKNSYHGDTFGAMSAAGKNEFNKPFWNHLFDVIAINPTIEDLSFQLKHCQPACFIFEPLILGSGGMRIYDREMLNAMLKLCHEKQIITIADEVMTGFGRTGTLFASYQLNFMSDIICLSKGLTGGFLPLGATLCKKPIYQQFFSDDAAKASLHGHSYTANPLSCASALASLDLLKKDDCT